MQYYRVSFFVLSLFYFSTAFSQSNPLDRIISINQSNKTILSVLEEIEKLVDVTFTYNSNIIDENKAVSVSVKDNPLALILKEILGSKYQYRLLGNQILIYVPQDKEPDLVEKNTAQKVESGNDPKPPVVDTVIFHDTIRHIQVDTIRRTIVDSIRVYDTIRPKEIMLKQSKRSCISVVLDQFLLQSNTVSAYSAFELKYNFLCNDFIVGTGIALAAFSKEERFSLVHSYVDSLAPYNKDVWYWDYFKVTDISYVTPGGDTILYEYYDSVYTLKQIEIFPQKTDSSTYFTTNSFHYLQIPITVAYRFSGGKYIDIIPSITLSGGLLLSQKGYYKRDNGIERLQKKYVNTFLLSTAIAVTCNYKIAQNISVFAEPRFHYNFNSFYASELTKQRNNSYWSLAVGASFKL